MTFDMRSHRFLNKSDTSWKYPAKIFVCRSIFYRNTIYWSVIIKVNWSPQIPAHKEDGVSFSLLFLCVSRKTHRQTVSASAVNLLRQKRKKRTLAKTLGSSWVDSVDSVFCSRAQINARTCNPSISSQALYHCPPHYELFYLSIPWKLVISGLCDREWKAGELILPE